MNKFIATGRLTKDAELTYLPNVGTPKLTYTIAVEREYQKDKNNKKVDFINCEMLGKHCENLCQYVTKGKLIAIDGELNIENYKKDGEKRSYTKIKVNRLEFLGGTSEKKDNQSGLVEIESDDIPF